MSSHHDTHDHHHAAPASFNLAFLIAIIVNAGFVILQAVFAISAHSMSLLADAAHNLGDVLGLVLAWGANWLMTLPARKRYSYGFRRTTIMAALINAIILTGSSVLVAWGAIEKLLHLSPLDSRIVFFVALAGIIINGSTALLFMRGAHHDLNIKSAFLHLAADALISFGVVIAAILIYFTRAFWIDPVTALAIVGIITWSTFELLRDSISLMLDGIPRHIDQHAIRIWLENLPGVTAVHDLHIWGLSTREVALTAHLVMPEGKISDAAFCEINAALKQQFRIDHATLQTESGDIQYPCHIRESC